MDAQLGVKPPSRGPEITSSMTSFSTISVIGTTLALISAVALYPRSREWVAHHLWRPLHQKYGKKAQDTWLRVVLWINSRNANNQTDSGEGENPSRAPDGERKDRGDIKDEYIHEKDKSKDTPNSVALTDETDKSDNSSNAKTSVHEQRAIEVRHDIAEVEEPRSPLKRVSRSIKSVKKSVGKKLIGLFDPGRAQQEEKQLKTRSHFAHELFDTERSYVETLNAIVTHYYEPLTKMKWITQQEVDVIFSDIVVIHNIHKAVLESIEKRLKDWSSKTIVGDVFEEMGAFLRVYTPYLNNYNNALTTLHHCQKSTKEFRLFLQSLNGTEKSRNLDLAGLLIAPVQRIPRYVMLLDGMLKNTPHHHSDHAHLVSALELVRNVADDLNERKRKAENMQKVVEIQELLASDIEVVSPTRTFVREGTLHVVIKPATKSLPLHVFLFNDLLVLCKVTKSRSLFKSRDSSDGDDGGGRSSGSAGSCHAASCGPLPPTSVDTAVGGGAKKCRYKVVQQVDPRTIDPHRQQGQRHGVSRDVGGGRSWPVFETNSVVATSQTLEHAAEWIDALQIAVTQ